MIELFSGSTTHKGTGLFTRHALAKDDILLEMQGPRLNFAELVVSPYYAVDHYFQIAADEYIGSSGGLDDLINHSCEPNCGIREKDGRFFLCAIRDLPAGTEISFDYSTVMNDGSYKMDCACGSPVCRRVVGDFRDLPEHLMIKYLGLGIVLPYIAKDFGHLNVPAPEVERELVPVRARKKKQTMRLQPAMV
ncbi:MAG: SET domain-containing protein-lysine N-methyltransferase [Candidatus Peregrinibacteria bacterium]